MGLHLPVGSWNFLFSTGLVPLEETVDRSAIFDLDPLCIQGSGDVSRNSSGGTIDERGNGSGSGVNGSCDTGRLIVGPESPPGEDVLLDVRLELDASL